MIVRRIASEYHRALAAGEPPEQAEQTAFLVVSAEFAGERVYIAGLPKAQRARQVAKLHKSAARDVAVVAGISERWARRLMRGK